MTWPLPDSQSHFALPPFTTFILVILLHALHTSSGDLFSAGKIPLLAPMLQCLCDLNDLPDATPCPRKSSILSHLIRSALDELSLLWVPSSFGAILCHIIHHTPSNLFLSLSYALDCDRKDGTMLTTVLVVRAVKSRPPYTFTEAINAVSYVEKKKKVKTGATMTKRRDN